MRIRRWAVAVAALALLPGLAAADGYGLGVYHYVNPPPYLRLVNVAPTGVTESVPINAAYTVVATPDAQVTIQFNQRGTFGNPAGQRKVRVRIRPLHHYVALPAGSHTLDGNVYGLAFALVPSGQPVTRVHHSVLITLDAPHNSPSNEFEGVFGGHWKSVCPKTTILSIDGLPSCYTKALPSEVAILYIPGSRFGKGGHRHGTSGGSNWIPILVVAGIVVVLGIILAVIMRRRGMVRR
jgi:hypothetical protein